MKQKLVIYTRRSVYITCTSILILLGKFEDQKSSFEGQTIQWSTEKRQQQTTTMIYKTLHRKVNFSKMNPTENWG